MFSPSHFPFRAAQSFSSQKLSCKSTPASLPIQQTCPNMSKSRFYLAGIPRECWMVPGLCPPWTSALLAGTVQIPVVESFRHFKTSSLDYTKCSPGTAVICHFSILRIWPRNQLVLLGARYSPIQRLLYPFAKDSGLWLKNDHKAFLKSVGQARNQEQNYNAGEKEGLCSILAPRRHLKRSLSIPAPNNCWEDFMAVIPPINSGISERPRRPTATVS